MVNHFGMDPVLPAFAGFLPNEFQEKYPDSETQKLSTWSHFNCTYRIKGDAINPKYKNSYNLFLAIFKLSRLLF